MARRRNPTALSDLVPRVIEDLGVTDRLEEVRIVEAWTRIVGPRLQANMGRVRVQGDRLHVEVRSAAWRQVLHLQREGWRRRLNESLGAERIREVVFR